MSTATIETPAQTPPAAPAPPAGRMSFAAALKVAEGKAEGDTEAVEQPKAKPETADPAPTEQVKEAVQEEPKAPAAKTPKVKPSNALDALLSGGDAAEAKPEEKKEATSEDPLKDFPADAKDKDRNWGGLRKKAEDGWKRVQELEQRLSAPDPKLIGELDTTRKTLSEREAALKELEGKISEYKDAMTAVNIELDPDYRREFIDGRKALVATAAAKLKTYGGDEKALAEALAMPEGLRRDEMLEAVLTDLSETARAKILRTVSDVEALDEKRAAILSSPQASFEELQRRHAAQAQAAAEQAEAVKKSTFDKMLKELASTVPTLGIADESLEGGKEWNTDRAASNQEAFALLSDEATPEQIVAASIKAANYGRLEKLYLGARKQLAEQASRLAEYESALPDTKGHRKPVPTKQEQMAKMSPGERFAHAMGSQKNDDF